MKFTVDIEIDYIDEEGNLDDEISRMIINKLSDKLLNTFNDQAGKNIAVSAERLITAKTELLINSLLEKPVEISNGWNNKKTYDSIYDMVEQKMTALYDDKFKDTNTCGKDPILSKIESYVKSEVSRLLTEVEKVIKVNANKAAKKELQESELIKAIGVSIKDKKI